MTDSQNQKMKYLSIVISALIIDMVNCRKITICHYNSGKKVWNTISIGASAWNTHQRHGNGTHNDYIGSCIDETIDTMSSETPTNSPTVSLPNIQRCFQQNSLQYPLPNTLQ